MSFIEHCTESEKQNGTVGRQKVLNYDGLTYDFFDFTVV